MFEHLYRTAIAHCSNHESYLFQTDQFTDRFVPTGDGGFLILDTPLHALAFALWFQLELTSFNSGFTLPRMRRLLNEPLTVRYAITQDALIHYESDWYGAAIINNARILSRDSLNRCLVDANSASWFAHRLTSFENLLALVLPGKNAIREFSGFQSSGKASMLFADPPQVHSAILQKVGPLPAKGHQFDVYSAYVQVGLLHGRPGQPADQDIIASVGNLNTAGLDHASERPN